MNKASLRIEKRRGKTITIIECLAVSDFELEKLLKTLKQKCATGGTVKEHHIELQGEFREKVKQLLPQLGYMV